MLKTHPPSCFKQPDQENPRGHKTKTIAPVRSCVLSVQLLSRVQLFGDPRDYKAHQTPLPMEFSRQHHWSRLPFPSPGDLADQRIKFVSPALADGVFTTEPHNETWLPLYVTHKVQEVYGYNLQFVLKPCLFGSLINSSYLSWAYHLPLAKPAEKFADCFANGPIILLIFLCSVGGLPACLGCGRFASSPCWFSP